MNGIVIGAMMAFTMVQQTDTVLRLDGQSAVNVESMGGSIRVDTWDREEVRVRADHSTRTYVDIVTRRNTVYVEAEARRGPANIADFHLTVPRRMNLSLEGQFTHITVEGADGEVEAETVQGNISIQGGTGHVRVSSATGSITVVGAQGRIEVESAASEIRIKDSSGDITAESAGGNLILENVRARSVDVGTVGGRVHFDGTLEAGGTYFFGSHGGSVTLVLPESVRATFNVATVHGTISSNLVGVPSDLKRGQRHQFEVGGGGPLVEAETFGGPIRILRKGSGEARPPEAAPRRTPDDAGALAGFAPALPGLGADVARAVALAQPRIEIDVATAMAFAQPQIAAEVERAMASVRPEIDASVGTALATIRPAINAAVSVGLALSPPATIRR